MVLLALVLLTMVMMMMMAIKCRLPLVNVQRWSPWSGVDRCGAVRYCTVQCSRALAQCHFDRMLKFQRWRRVGRSLILVQCRASQPQIREERFGPFSDLIDFLIGIPIITTRTWNTVSFLIVFADNSQVSYGGKVVPGERDDGCLCVYRAIAKCLSSLLEI